MAVVKPKNVWLFIKSPDIRYQDVVRRFAQVRLLEAVEDFSKYQLLRGYTVMHQKSLLALPSGLQRTMGLS